MNNLTERIAFAAISNDPILLWPHVRRDRVRTKFPPYRDSYPKHTI